MSVKTLGQFKREHPQGTTPTASTKAGPGVVVTGAQGPPGPPGPQGSAGVPGTDTDAALTIDLSAVPDHPSATGVYTANEETFDSSIDDLEDLTYTFTYDQGCAANAVATATPMPILVSMHGYHQDAGNITGLPWNRQASHNFFIVAVNMRGRRGDPGNPDDSARERQDIRDAVAAAAAAHPTLADPKRRYGYGYSGGAANLLMMAAADPGYFIAVMIQFGWGDYGLNPNPGRSYVGSGDDGPGAPTLVTRIGPRSDMQPYRARTALFNIATALTQTPTKVFMFWDEADPVGIALRDVRDVLKASGAPASRWYAGESLTTDDERWLHGYPDNSPDLILIENVIHRMAAEPAPSLDDVALVGECLVLGHIAYAFDDAGIDPLYEIWTADDAVTSPRLDPTGGQYHMVRARFNVPSMHFYLSPMSGPCAVTVKMGSVTKTAIVTDPETLFDLANDADVSEPPGPGALFHEVFTVTTPDAILDAADVTLASGADVATWPTHAGSVSTFTAATVAGGAAAPQFDSDDGGYPSVALDLFAGKHMTAAYDIGGDTEWAFVQRFRVIPGANSGCPFSFTDAAGNQNDWAAAASTDLAQFFQVAVAGADCSGTDNAALGVGYHTLALWYDPAVGANGTVYMRLDKRATKTALRPAGTLDLERLCIGMVQRTGGNLYLFQGSVSNGVFFKAIPTTQELNDAADWTPP